jgi:hypothetical protein
MAYDQFGNVAAGESGSVQALVSGQAFFDDSGAASITLMFLQGVTTTRLSNHRAEVVRISLQAASRPEVNATSTRLFSFVEGKSILHMFTMFKGD